MRKFKISVFSRGWKLSLLYCLLTLIFTFTFNKFIKILNIKIQRNKVFFKNLLRQIALKFIWLLNFSLNMGPNLIEPIDFFSPIKKIEIYNDLRFLDMGWVWQHTPWTSRRTGLIWGKLSDVQLEFGIRQLVPRYGAGLAGYKPIPGWHVWRKNKRCMRVDFWFRPPRCHPYDLQCKPGWDGQKNVQKCRL